MEDKILFVDDDAMVLSGLKRQLRNQFNIETALSGKEALKIIEAKGPYAVVVSDFLMPGMNGIELLSRVRDTSPETVRMMLTGSSDMKTAIKAVNEGNIFQFHLKPCSADILGQATKTSLEKYRKMAQDHMQLNKVRYSLAYAGEVQQALIPTSAPVADGFDFAGKTIWCDETGGNYYDFIGCGEWGQEKIGITVGDISGHGVSSALLMTMARAYLRERIRGEGGPACIIPDVNKRITRDTGELGFFMTLFYAEIDVKSKYFRWVRAGHEPAILYDSNSESFEDLMGQGLPLGMSEDAVYEESIKPINPGQVILVGTGGIKEICNAKGEMFGKNRLKKIIRDHAQKTAKDVIAAVIDELEHFRFPLKKENDITLVVIKVLELPITAFERSMQR
jgi:sigma-B regulation protein RsbU (phosphoserine phosphatase)